MKVLLMALAILALSSETRAATLEVFSLTPAFSPFNAAGRTVTIKGVGFRPATTVKFDTVASPTVTFVDSRTLTAVVPTVALAGVSTVVVTDSVNGSDQFYPYQYTGPVFFVSLTGSDSNNGTTPTTPFRTIGKGLGTATSTTPTEVRVSAGTYVENSLTLQNDTTLVCGWAPGFAARDPEANITVIDGNRAAFIMRTGGLASVSGVDGCTFTHGLRDGFGGGGLVITADSPVVNNNVFVGNVSTTMGGAIYSTASTSYGALPTFSNNVIVGNRSHNKQGGGIVFYSNYNPQPPVRVNVEGNVIVGNRSFNNRGGGFALATGSYVNYNAGKLVMADNFVGYNRARSGGGVDLTLQSYSDYYQVSLNNNLIVGNAVPGMGGGLAFQGAGVFDGYVRGSTVAGNTAAPNQGGGFAAIGSTSLPANFVMSDLILWANAGGDSFGQVNSVAVYSNTGTLLPGAGDISSNPFFVSGPTGDHYLRQNDPNGPDSPSVNTGSTTAAGLAEDGMTTRRDLVVDTGLADHGYHYAPVGTNSPAAIALTRIDPSSGDFVGNDWVLLRGNGFDPGAVATFDGVTATHTIYQSPTRLLAQPVAHAQALVNVRVTNPDTTFSELAGMYRFLDNEPPVWTLTVGVQSALTAVDCQRTVVLDWGDAVDAASNPVVYEVYREDCVPSGNTTNPCANFGYVPSSVDFEGTTVETTYVDANNIPPSGQDPKYVYAVRARDSAGTGTNKEWNFAKRVSLATALVTDTTPPSNVGKTLNFISPTILDWTGAVGAVSYGVYRTTTASLYSSPGSLTKLTTLTKLTNDLNGDGITDTQYTDATVPTLGQAFFYKISALDICNVETIAELGP